MDVIVIGAGPAGTMAAKAVAEQGYSVTVYEKRSLKWEKPCGGAVSYRTQKEFNLDPENTFWDRKCQGVFLCSPQNKTVQLPTDTPQGYLVMREKFDYYLVKKSQKAGAKFIENTPVTPYIINGRVQGVHTPRGIQKANLVIACDGTPSASAQEVNIYKRSGYNQAATYQYQMKMDNAEIDEKIGNNLEIYFGHKWVPVGYSWIFPKKGIVTVGCGTWLHALRNQKINLKTFLDTFIATHPVASKKLENAEILYSQAAMIGFSSIINPIYLDNFMVAGDAAGFVSVPTGEGIYYSMVSGKIAGEVAVKSLQAENTSRTILKEYKKRIDEKIGGDMKWGPWLRKLALDKEKNQENIVKYSSRDQWIGNMTRDLILGDIEYDQFLKEYMVRPHKLLKLLLG